MKAQQIALSDNSIKSFNFDNIEFYCRNTVQMRKKRKLSIHGKAIAGIIIFTLLINIGMCLSGSVIFDRAVQKIYNERGYVVANIILKQIDHDKIAEYSGLPLEKVRELAGNKTA